MRKEKSCGCIIINNNKVLLVYEKNTFFWGFPKGHVENNETEVETAKRETKEEVGLEVKISEKNRYILNYNIRNRIEKTTVLFLSKPINDNVIIQEKEIEKYIWADIDEACDILTYEDSKKIFKKALSDMEKEDVVYI